MNKILDFPKSYDEEHREKVRANNIKTLKVALQLAEEGELDNLFILGNVGNSVIVTFPVGSADYLLFSSLLNEAVDQFKQ